MRCSYPLRSEVPIRRRHLRLPQGSDVVRRAQAPPKGRAMCPPKPGGGSRSGGRQAPGQEAQG